MAHVNELLITARNWVGEAIQHERTDDIVEFARGKILYKTPDNRFYDADVIVATKEDFLHFL